MKNIEDLEIKYRNPNIFHTFILVELMIFICIISFILGLTFEDTFDSPPQLTGEIHNENCNNLSLKDTSNCLNRELDSFFFYNKSQIGKTLNLDQLKEQGGVCVHSANYFESRGKELGFYSERVIFQYGDDNYHAVNIISDKTGYCLQDMYVNFCNTFINQSL
jgi:hypothetical protein